MTIKHLGAIQYTGDGKLHIIRALTDVESDQIAAGVNGLLRFQAEEHLYLVAQKNLEELDQFIVDALVTFTKATEGSLLRGIPPSHGVSLNIEANRHVLNVLTSFRMYLDHLETDIKRAFGADSRETESFQKACVHEYDSNPSYGFVYKLRNYTQHCGLPVAYVVLSGSRERLPNELAETRTAAFTSEHGHRSLVLSLDRDSLLKNFEWPRHVREFIGGQGEQFEARGHLGAAFRSLDSIHSHLVSEVMPEALQHATKLATFHDEVRRHFSDAAPVTVAPRGEDPRHVRIEGMMVEEVSSVLSTPKPA